MGSVREFIFFPPRDELTKIKNTFRKIDISAVRFSLASNFFPSANNIFSFFGRFS